MRFIQLTEAKARIDHPEDLIFLSQNTKGISNALNALSYIVHHPNVVSLKIDGSPALIFGRDNFGFTVTDKAGFAKRDGTGLPRTQQELIQMLYNRKPNEIGREIFATNIGECWNFLERLTPNDFVGYLQGDLLWIGTPMVTNGNITFKPNKITYSIPIIGSLGKQAATSRMGFVLHSYFAKREQAEPRAINLDQLNLKKVPGLLILDCQINLPNQLNWPTAIANKITTVLSNSTADINELLNPITLRSLGISDFADLCKKFLAQRASLGQTTTGNLEQEFFEWIQSDSTKLTDRKRANLILYCSSNSKACRAMWAAEAGIIEIKHSLYTQLELQTNTLIHAELRGKPQHEGFVVETPYGRIKLVNRAEFMRREDMKISEILTPLEEDASGGATSSGSIASVTSPFGRVLSREPNLFGYNPKPKTKKRKK